MGKVSRQDGVLKLVRAGGIVELYKHPIKAVQIMERYPRHCVTRPDIFEFPNIVVKPESVLRVGQVFYIVPYHTIYRLLKSKGYYCHPHYTPDHHDDSINKQTLQMEEIDTSFFHRIIPVENVRSKKQTIRQVAYLTVKENKDTCVIKDGDYDSDEALDAAASGCFPTRKKGEATKVTASRTGCLKPCLKKNRTNKKRPQQGPRVRFMLPDGNDGEKWDTDFSEV